MAILLQNNKVSKEGQSHLDFGECVLREVFSQIGAELSRF